MGLIEFVASAGEALQKLTSGPVATNPFAPTGAIPPNPFAPTGAPAPNPFAPTGATPPNPFAPTSAPASAGNPFAPDTSASPETAQALAAKVAALGLSVQGLTVRFSGGTATVEGHTASQADKEKVVLALGNTVGVAAVDDRLVPAKPEPAAVFHTVAKGDTLGEIARKLLGNAQRYPEIFEANRPMLTHPDKIYPGQVLRIPTAGGGSHTVKAGETLGTIAKQHYGDPKHYMRIFEANRGVLSDPNKIAVGQVLVIPQ